MHKEEDSYDPEEGARPSSLIAVHKLATPDPIYDLQLMRDLEIINARTRAELGPLPAGGVPARSDRKPEVRPFTATEQSQEDETMKLQNLTMAAALALGVAGAASAMEPNSHSRGEYVSEHAASTEPDRKPTSKESEEGGKPRLGPEFKRIRIFSDFRKKLIEDGWLPVPDPDCHDTVLGDYYDEYCSKNPNSISCRLCTLVPEIAKNTSDGYNLMRYTKRGVPLSVTVYGDVNDLDVPGHYGLVPIGWEYSDSLNVMLLD